MRATISVVIPNYNRANLIGETLDNMLRQTRPPDELIVVDDGSTDESASVIKSFGDRVRLICQSNRGPAEARNLGLKHASGDFVQLFDSDDLCTLNKLEVQSAALERTAADFAYSPWVKAWLDKGRAVYSEQPLQQRGLPDHRSPLEWFLRGWVIVFQCCMFRRRLLNMIGPYRPDLMPSEDSELLFRILKAGGRGVHVPEALVLYRLHEAGQITGGAMNQAKRSLDWARYVDLVARQLDGDGERIGRLDALRWRALVWAAHRQLGFLRNGEVSADDFDKRFGLVENGMFWLIGCAKRVRAGLRARIVGTRLPPFYQARALTSRQEDLIREIGYEPVRARRQARRGQRL